MEGTGIPEPDAQSYLLTGGGGFIGSHLAEFLLDRNAEVHIFDDFSTGSADNLAPLSGRPGFRVIQGSILDEPALSRAIRACDVVIHLASAVGVKYIHDNPLKSIEVNARGTQIVLHHASRFRRKVFLASTSEVYGRQRRPLLKEEDYCSMGPTTVTRWSYAYTKALSEVWGHAYWKAEKLPVIIARLFNIVGPRQSGEYGMVLPRFIQAALSGNPITVYGDGRQSRTFTHIKDAIQAIHLLLSTDAAVGQIINVGGKEEISIRDLAELVKSITGSSSPIVYVPYEEVYSKDFEDMPRRVPDLSSLKRLTGFEPRYSVRQILEDVVSYFRAAAPGRICAKA